MSVARMCVNGCQKPVHAPSKVLCLECFKKLSAKFDRLAAARGEKKCQ